VRQGSLEHPLIVMVGAGGVGKTTLAAAWGLQAARQGHDTLVMTFDPSLRLKDALGVGERGKDRPVRVPVETPGRLDVALLDARATFDRLVARYAPDRAAARRIFANRFYRDLAGHLAGILEYMAVERLFEVAAEGRYGRVVLDTPPTRQALDFLEAPDRIVNFLDSGPLRAARSPWFRRRRGVAGLPRRLAAKGVEKLLDRFIGVRLLGDLVEFFEAFAPLFEGFRARAEAVRALLRRPGTGFVLVAGPGEDRIPDTLFFARKLREAGHHLALLVVNQVHPLVPAIRDGAGPLAQGLALLRWLGERDRQGIAELRQLCSPGERLAAIPLLPEPPSDLAGLEALGRLLAERVGSGG
jgi:anion-transporting  ArsA/GET3 family ATPase